MGEKEVFAFLEQYCTHILYDIGLLKLPIQLEAVVNALGVSEVVYEPMHAEGYVQQEGGHIKIHINQDKPLVRQRFSLAHEIGHVIWNRLQDPAGRDYTKFRQTARVSEHLDEETIADFIAGQLLLPSSLLRVELGDRLHMDDVSRLASKAKCSIAAALIRTVGVATESCAAFMARSMSGEPYRVLWSRGSASATKHLIDKDLADPWILSSLLSRGDAWTADSCLRWTGCSVVNKEWKGTHTIYGLARVNHS